MKQFLLSETMAWEISGGTLTISGTGEMWDFDALSNNAPWLEESRKLIRKIIISEGVTNIGSWAFYGCSSLTSVIIPNSVTNIGRWAFYGCSSLTSITIPNSVMSIDGVFSGCKIEVDSENSYYKSEDGVLFDKAMTTLIRCPERKQGEYVIPSSVTRIEEKAFLGCKYLTSITIPEGVTSIEGSAFSGCISLTSIAIPSSVKNIGGYAFSNCSSLTSITISNGVTSIGGRAFEDCSGLTSISIPSSVTYIENRAFYGCSGLTSIEVSSDNNNYKSKDGVLFNKAMTTLIICPAGKEGEYVIPSSVTSIEMGAFRSCSNLISVVIPNGITSIGGGTFWGCSNLTSVVIPSSVTSIGNYAFSNCSSLKHIEFHSLFPPKATSYCCEKFFGIDKIKCILYVPAKAVSAYKNDLHWRDFNNIFTIEEKASISLVKINFPQGSIVIKNAPVGETIDVYNEEGRLVGKQYVASPEITIALPQGMYIVKIGNAIVK